MKGIFGDSARRGATIFVVGTYDGQRDFHPGLPSDFGSRYGTTSQSGFPMQKVGNKFAQVSADVCGGSGFNRVIPGKGSGEASYAGTQVLCTQPTPETDKLARFAEGCGIGSPLGGAAGCIILGFVDVMVREPSDPSGTSTCTARQTTEDGRTVKTAEFKVNAPNEVQINKDGSVEVTDKEHGDFTTTVLPPNPEQPCENKNEQTPPEQTSTQDDIEFPPLDLTEGGMPSEPGSGAAVPGWLMAFLSDWKLLPTGSRPKTPGSGVIDYGPEGAQSGTSIKPPHPGEIDPGDQLDLGGTHTSLDLTHNQPGQDVIDHAENDGVLGGIGRVGGGMAGGPIGTSGGGAGGSGGMVSPNEYRNYLLSQIEEYAVANSYSLEEYDRIVKERCQAAGITPPPRQSPER